MTHEKIARGIRENVKPIAYVFAEETSAAIFASSRTRRIPIVTKLNERVDFM